MPVSRSASRATSAPTHATIALVSSARSMRLMNAARARRTTSSTAAARATFVVVIDGLVGPIGAWLVAGVFARATGYTAATGKRLVRF